MVKSIKQNNNKLWCV